MGMALNIVVIGCQVYLNIAGRRGRWLSEVTEGQAGHFGDSDKGKHLDVRHWRAITCLKGAIWVADSHE